MIIRDHARNETDRLLEGLGYDLLEECREAVSIAGIPEEIPVLDVATGSGRMAGVLSETGRIVYSGDINCDALLKVRNRLGEIVGESITFIPLDAEQMPFPNESFRAIVCANALHEMQDPRSVLSEMIRVCARDGRLLVTDFNANGFEVMEQVHRQTHGKQHNRGSITADEIHRRLSCRFTRVQHHSLPLNDVWIASNKRANATDTQGVHSACFACGDRNQNGLRLRFQPLGKYRVSAEYVLGEEYQGYPGIVQGGIVSTLLDSAMMNCLLVEDIQAMTVRLNVRFREPVYVGRSITIAASLIRRRGEYSELKASIMQDGKQKASAEAKFLVGRESRKAGQPTDTYNHATNDQGETDVQREAS